MSLEFAHPLAINGKRFIHAEIFALGHEEARKDVRAVCEQFTKAVPLNETTTGLGDSFAADATKTVRVMDGERFEVTKIETHTHPFTHSEWGNAVEAKR